MTDHVEVLVEIVIERHLGRRDSREKVLVGLNKDGICVHGMVFDALHEVVGHLGADEVEEDEQPVVGDRAVL